MEVNYEKPCQRLPLIGLSSSNTAHSFLHQNPKQIKALNQSAICMGRGQDSLERQRYHSLNSQHDPRNDNESACPLSLSKTTITLMHVLLLIISVVVDIKYEREGERNKLPEPRWRDQAF